MTQALQTTTQPTTAALQTGGVFGTFDALEKFGNYIWQSKMFGARNPAEGFVIAVTCQQEKMSLLQFKERFHVMMGQVTTKAETMLSNLLELGGVFEIISKTPDYVALKLTYKKASFLSEIKWDDIKNEDYVRATSDENGKTYKVFSNNGEFLRYNTPPENRRFKDNWSTPRRRMQMMWARAVSDGVRTVCPLATRGHYTPEEAVDFDDQPKTINVTPAPVAYPQEVAAAPTPAPAPIVEAPAEPPMQPVTQPTAAAKPMPMFQAPKGPDDLDYTTCRIEGKMCGKKWAEMPIEHLQLALQITDPNLYQQDREQIEALIMQRSAAVDIADN